MQLAKVTILFPLTYEITFKFSLEAIRVTRGECIKIVIYYPREWYLKLFATNNSDLL